MLWPRIASSQLDSLVDVFPLAEGNRWTYGWYAFAAPKNGVATVDTGTAEYVVYRSIATADSIRWFLWQRRTLRHGPPG